MKEVKKILKGPRIKGFSKYLVLELNSKPYQNDNLPSHYERIKYRILEFSYKA